MPLTDTNVVIRTYALTQALLTALIGGASPRLYWPKIPQNKTGASLLPCVSFFNRGGSSSPYIPGIPSPSIQVSCWADNAIDAREVYRAWYDVFQGIQNVNVVVDGDTYQIMSAREEVQGQDIQDDEFPDWYRVLSFWEIMVRASLT